MSQDDDVDIRIRLKEAARFNREAKSAARSVDEIGDQARQAARSMGELGAASSKTRVSLGPFSTSMRGGVLAVGALALGVKKLTPQLLSGAEAVTTMAGGAGAAGGVGLLALAQGATVAKLGLSGLTDALGGSEAAARSLSPELRDLFMTLNDQQSMLKQTAEDGLLPGLGKGAGAASRDFGVLNRVVGKTAKTLGGLAEDAGVMLGSGEWGRDLNTLGSANVKILDDLGHAGLHLADAVRNVATEAAPLAVWMAGSARDGAVFIDQWTAAARASGDMAHFFRDARHDLTLLASAGGHGGRGIINLFGAHDVDGTNTLRNLDRVMARFERWSRTAQGGVGDAIIAEIPEATAAVMDSIARNLGPAGIEGAKLFLHGFMEADVWGKALAGGWLFSKLGGFKTAGKLMGGGSGGGLLGMKPIPVLVTNPGWDKKPNAKPPATILGKVSTLAKGGGVLMAALAGKEIGEHLHDDWLRQQSADRGMSAEQIRGRAASTHRGFQPLSGETVPSRQPVLDAQGFPTGKYEIVVHNTVELDGEQISHNTSRRVARRRARKAGSGFGGPAGP